MGIRLSALGRHVNKVLVVTLFVLITLLYTFSSGFQAKQLDSLASFKTTPPRRPSPPRGLIFNDTDEHFHNTTSTGPLSSTVDTNNSSLPLRNTTLTTAPASNNTSLPLCPPVPPNLVGHIRVFQEAPSLKDLTKRFSTLEPGGRSRPTDCQARDKVAIIVPYRDRELHLRIFLENLHPLLQKQQLDYGIFIVEQFGQGLFNRATLMNVGFVEALKLYDFDCFVFHDVDLLPEDDRNLYTCPEEPRHMSVAIDKLNYKLPYVGLFGGVSALTREQFQTVNGFSNMFLGWGGEDDDMANRIKHYGLHITRYPEKIARYKMLSHKKQTPSSTRFQTLNTGQTRFKTDGLNSLKYDLKSVELETLYTKFFVELEATTVLPKN